MKRDDGFTLIEVLVAFAILSLALAGIYAALADSARAQAELKVRAETLREAQSHLVRLVIGPYAPAETVGRYANGTVWSASVMPLGRFGGATTMTAPARLALTVRDVRGRVLVELETVALLARSP